MNRNAHTQRERDPMGGEEKKKGPKNIYIQTTTHPPWRKVGSSRHQGGADWGWFGCQGVFLAFFFFSCPSTWVVPIVKGESRRVGEGTGEKGGAAGIGSAAGEMPKKQNKTRFHFVCTSLGAGERGREGGRGRRAPPESRRAQTRACGHVPPQPPRQPLPLPRPPLPAHPASPAKSELARLPRLRRTKPSPIPEPALTVSKVTGASSAC